MRHRLYWLLPDLESARRTANDLLLARVEDRRMRFLALRGTDLGELHAASVFDRTDVRQAAARGGGAGALLGLLLALALWRWAPDPWRVGPAEAIVAVAASTLFGVWASSLAGASVPNSTLRRFDDALEGGRILLILDLPARRVPEVRALLARRHPEAAWSGEEATVPAFP